jgi:flagellar hook-associated protein 2
VAINAIQQPAVTFSGVASGVDTESIVNALVDVAHRPISLLENRRSDLVGARSIWSNLDDKVDDLESSLRSLKTRGRLLSSTTSVSDKSVLTAKASGSASTGSYQVTVNEMARAGSQASQAYANTDTLTVGTGMLQVTVGTTTTDITISSSSNTVDEIASAINNSDADVNATVIATEPGGPYRLVVTGNETGELNDVTVDASGLSGGDQALSISTLRAARNSSITVNGLDVERSGNSITDVVEGLSLSLVSEGNTSTITVSLDVAGVKSTIENFTSAYNNVMSIIDGQMSYSADTGGVAPPLLGDFSLRGMRSRLQTALHTSVDVTGGTKLSMAVLGIQSNTDGTLEIDSSTFTSAFEGDLDDITTFFTQMNTGFAAKVQSVLDTVTDPVDGTLKSRNDAISLNLKHIDNSIERQQSRLDSYEQTLRRRFASFESLMGKLNSQSQYLTQQLMQNQS